ncbi:ankyrin repeat and LEM domain-containing protein 1 homolog [Prorops nasuta]|uniref:ankyrin repeat and LEM domain-containing protein 1 homolog n=1 Tax=Prorops nasuta TaxID=863751 RepID=UPI0034CEA06F
MLSAPKEDKNLYLASTLCECLKKNDLMQIKFLMETGTVNPNTFIPSTGITPFHLAVGNECQDFAIEVTKLFLQCGGNPNVRAVDGLTPVHVAAAWDRIDILELLLANGGNVLNIDEEGHNAYHYAFEGMHYQAVKILDKYSQFTTDNDDDQRPKYKMLLDKILIFDGKNRMEYLVLNNNKILIKNDLSDLQELPLNLELKKLPSIDEFSNLSDAQETNYTSNNVTINLSRQVKLENNKTFQLKNQVCGDNSDDNLSYSIDHSIVAMSPNFKIPRLKKLPPKNCDKFVEVSPDVKNVKVQNCLLNLKKDRMFNNMNTFLCNTKKHISSKKNIGETNKDLVNGKNMLQRFYDADKNIASPYIPILSQDYSNMSIKGCTYSSAMKQSKAKSGNESNTTNTDSLNSLQVNCQEENLIDESYYSSFNSTHNTEDKQSVFTNESLNDSDCPSNNSKISLNFNYNSNDNEFYMKKEIDMSMANNVSTSTHYTIEEYRYEDLENGVALIERRPAETTTSSDETDDFKSANSTVSGYKKLNLAQRIFSSLPDMFSDIGNATLRKLIINLGGSPGPITDSTRNIYLKKLVELQEQVYIEKSKIIVPNELISRATPASLKYGDWVSQIKEYQILETNVFKEFHFPDPMRAWREGKSKQSFNYLLLDSRITCNLPYRTSNLSKEEAWNIFISAIFYVGKGKSSRPYSHFYDAFQAWISKINKSSCKKISHIMNIWNSGHGVICLQIFQNTIPVEAYTREAAMIDALNIDNLDNCKKGDYYGVMATWNLNEKAKFGRYLLYKAQKIFINEGERLIFPDSL